MGKPVYAFGYFGGKLSHLKNILPMLPTCHTYVEPFGGSAAVLLNRSPSPVEVYNDLDGDVPNFFRVLRDHRDELILNLELTPYSRQEFVDSIIPIDDASDLERARRFFVRHNQAYGNVPNATPGRWGHVIDMSRRGMAGNVSAWHGNIDNLAAVASRLLSVQIEWAPAVKVIEDYDTLDTLFYVDPPYPNETREQASTSAYRHEMTTEQHVELASTLCAAAGKVAVSSYASDLYDVLYAGWNKTVFEETMIPSSRNRNQVMRQEILWTNYDPPNGSQLGLFAENGEQDAR